MAGTNRSIKQQPKAGPLIVLVEPQMGENIGAAARAMLNFGLTGLRLVKPRDGWPNPAAGAMAAGASEVIDSAEVFETVEEAVADCGVVLATTARPRDMLKPVLTPDKAAEDLNLRRAEGIRTAVLFGGERAGLSTADVAKADAILTIPINPGFASLNLAQAVLVVAYAWGQASGASAFESNLSEAAPASKAELFGLFAHLEEALDGAGYFFPESKREIMTRNLRTMLTRASLTPQEVQTLRGVIKALEHGPRRAARAAELENNES